MPKQVEIAPGYVVEFPDSMSQDAIDQASAKLYQERQAGTATAAPSLFQRVGAVADRAVEALPTAMATGMSLLAGGRSNPVGMGLAAIGGAGGEGFRQTIDAVRGKWDRIPDSMAGQVMEMGKAGAEQGALEGVGRVLVAPALKAIGSGIYRSVLKPSAAVRAEFPNATKTLVEAGVPIARSGSGTERTAGLLSGAARDTRDTIAAADAAGAKPVNMRPVAQALDRTRASVSDQAIRDADLEKVQKLRDQLLKENPGPVSLTDAQAMKQAEQRRAVDAYKKQARGLQVNEIRLSAREDIARGLREAIERRVPDAADKNKRTQELIGALKAISGAEGRIANRNLLGMGDALSLATALGGYEAAGSKGLLAGVVQEVLTRPEVASRIGITFDRLGNPRVTPQVLRALGEAANQMSVEDGRESPRHE